jgi:hypothetical protein
MNIEKNSFFIVKKFKKQLPVNINNRISSMKKYSLLGFLILCACGRGYHDGYYNDGYYEDGYFYDHHHDYEHHDHGEHREFHEDGGHGEHGGGFHGGGGGGGHPH